jgi:hypothetical protein
MRRRFGWGDWVTIGAATVVLAASIAAAIRQNSLDPIWTVGWLPAVIVAQLGRRERAKRCWPFPRRRSDA